MTNAKEHHDSIADTLPATGHSPENFCYRLLISLIAPLPPQTASYDKFLSILVHDKVIRFVFKKNAAALHEVVMLAKAKLLCATHRCRHRLQSP